MRQEAPPDLALRLVATRAEHDLATEREGVRADRACRLGRRAVGVDTNCAEIVAETRLEHGACRGIERLAVRAQCRMDGGRRRGLAVPPGRFTRGRSGDRGL